MVLTEEMAKWVRTEGFVNEGPAAEEMHLAIGSPVDHVTEGPGKKLPAIAVMASPEAWEALAIWLRRNSYRPWGERDANTHRGKKLVKMNKRAQVIEKELVRLSNHPAYRGHGIAVPATHVLPARRVKGDPRWWPTIRMALRAGIAIGSDELEIGDLWPEMTFLQNRYFTFWRFQPADERTEYPPYHRRRD